MPAATELDPEELMHLALASMQEGNNEDAMRQLKQAVEQSPKNGKLLYLLGAVHAQIGLYDRAIEEMTTATQLAPEISAAHFQLGLLHFTAGQNYDDAIAAWRPLDKLDQDDPLRLFKTGLAHLGKKQYAQCIDALERGIQLCNQADLNKDMARVAQNARIKLENSGVASGQDLSGATALPDSSSKETDSSSRETQTQHVLLTRYRQPEKH